VGLGGCRAVRYQNKALNYGFLLYANIVSFKVSNQPKALTTSHSPPPWIQK